MDHEKNENLNWYTRRWEWCEYLQSRRDFTHGDFRVGFFIASKINPRTGSMWWSLKKIAREMQISLATVVSAVRKLESAGLVVITKGAKGANIYSMRMPLDPHMSAMNARPETRKRTGGRKPRVSKTETVWVSKTET